MSGRRIDDHATPFGGKEKGSQFPSGPHKLKEFSSADGSGHLGSMYPDTTEQIKSGQEKGNGKIKSHPMKEGNRY